MDQAAELLEQETEMTISIESFIDLAVPLRHNLNEIYESAQTMKQMALALEQVCKIIDRGEEHVIDEIEKERIVFERFEIAMIHIPSIMFTKNPMKITW